jgi:uncharacterized delta-60 repeat protein
MKLSITYLLAALSWVITSSIIVFPNGPGNLDLTFAGTGYRQDLSGTGMGVAVQSDGKIVTVANISGGFSLIRYNTEGSLDASFGNGGSVLSANGLGSQALILQPDGKILVAGTSNSPTKIALVRYNSDGSIDTSFGGGVMVTTQILPGPCGATSAAIQPDGKIVVAGIAFDKFTPYFALVRYNPNGSIDTSFDGDGKVTIRTLSAFGSSVAVQPDGKIVAAGGSNSSGGPTDIFALTRYNPNGSIDTTFDGDGVVTTPMLEGGSHVYSIVLLPDGRIVAGGWTGGTLPDRIFDFAVARYNADGSLDLTFDGDGKATTPVLSEDDYLYQILVQPDGKIVAAGYAQNGTNADMALVRYNTDGSLDSDYGSGGKAVIDLGASETIYGAALDDMGKAIIVGGGGANRVLIARITAEFAPLVEVGGRVTSTNGQGIGNATVVLTGENNVSQTARTNAFGFYSFPGVSSNEVYTVRVSSKRYRFQPSSQTIILTATVANVDFVGNPGSESKNAVEDAGTTTVEPLEKLQKARSGKEL